MRFIAEWWPLLLVGGLCVGTGWAFWKSWTNQNRDIILESKAEEYVNDAMQAEKARAETRIEKTSDHEALSEFEKNFGGPGK